MPIRRVPDSRVLAANDAPIRKEGEIILYWMIAARRTRWNYGLQRAVEWARKLDRPLVVLEALRCDYRWASDRLHLFALQGMADNAARLQAAGVTYLPFIEAEKGGGKGLLQALAGRACVVVTDEAPIFFLPRMVAAAADKLMVRLETIDSNGLLPQGTTARDFTTAFSFRAFLQKMLPEHLEAGPLEDPLAGSPLRPLKTSLNDVLRRWPMASKALLEGRPAALARLPIDHAVPPSPIPGGPLAAERTLQTFLSDRLDRYPNRNHPDDEVASGLSPYLHWGHTSTHQIFHAIVQREAWTPARLGKKTSGSRAGWWGMSEAAEAFLDELVTWRELGFQTAHNLEGYDRYETLPAWAKRTLADHAADPRHHLYSLQQLEQARTGDPVWNTAQRQLLEEGRIHNYLRMVWGKRVLEWTRSPEEACAFLFALNDRWALDGRDPNSASGILWVFGRYDRAWGPERPVYGKVRYMSSGNALKKLRMKRYLARWGEAS